MENKTPFASIRRIVQLSPDIYKIKPGLYALKELQTQLEKNGIAVGDSTKHGIKSDAGFQPFYYQGLLLEIGNMKLMATFAEPGQKQKILNSTLGAIPIPPLNQCHPTLSRKGKTPVLPSMSFSLRKENATLIL